MSNRFRLSEGGAIDRSKSLSFTFNGKHYTGFEGDTLASALLANGVRHVARSFKYHRPRAVMAAGAEEPNAIVQLENGPKTEPDMKSTQVMLYEGLVARSVNAWPTLSFDIGAVNQLVADFIPAAFYYKTFMWPDWHMFEPSIRKAAGLGMAPDVADPSSYEQRMVDCDILVVGGGPAGLAAVKALSGSGARVIWCDDKPHMGGSLLHRETRIDDQDCAQWIQSVVSEAKAAGVRTLTSTTAFGYYDHNMVALMEDHPHSAPRKTFWKVRAGQVILATGSFERPLVFPNNDRPGIMLADSVCQYIGRYGVLPGTRALVATNNDSAYQAALDAAAAGVDIAAIVDSRQTPPTTLVAKAFEAGLSVMTGMAPTDTKGARALTQVTLHKIDEDGTALPGSGVTVDADLLMVSGGWSPTVHLFSQSGGKLRFDDQLQAFVPRASVQKEISVGSAKGLFSTRDCLQSGYDAACVSLTAAGLEDPAGFAPSCEASAPYTIAPLWRVEASAVSKGKSWIDYQNDVTATDVGVAAAENFRAVEHLKRYTTMGMAVDQGKTSNVNAIGVMAQLIDKPVPDIGTTKFRPPFNPVTLGALVGGRKGDQLNPMRQMPTADINQSLGALLEDFGGWMRPVCFPQAGETEHQALTREVLAVRQAAGLFDASPLGKIEVTGPDAGEFLNRIYVNRMNTLKPGKVRYGLMLNEDGIVFDDGVLSRLDEDRWLVGTTSGHVGHVTQNLEEWLQCEWLDLDVIVENVTSQWAVVSITGPKARDILAKLDCDIDLSAEAFPHMTVRTGTLEGVATRIARVSFTGELGYEISVPWGYGAALWQKLMDLGRANGLTPFGVESLMILRTEKGFLHIGSDTDGSTLPQDVGFGRILEKKAADFVGKRSALRADGQRTDRLNLVGIEPTDGGPCLPAGMHLIAKGAAAPAPSQGFVTSSYDSPTLGKPVGLALLEGGRSRIGEELDAYDLGATRPVRIVEAGAYDKDGERLNA